MLNKRAIELSLNFIVTIIISIVIFSFGIWFMSRLFNQANDLKDLTLKDLDNKIGDLVCEGSERVCMGINSKIIQRKNLDVFGLKVMNVLGEQNFEISVKAAGVTKDNQPIVNADPDLELKYRTEPVRIQQNDDHTFGIGVQVPANAVSGTYIFNVDIKNDGTSYAKTQKFYVKVP